MYKIIPPCPNVDVDRCYIGRLLSERILSDATVATKIGSFESQASLQLRSEKNMQLLADCISKLTATALLFCSYLRLASVHSDDGRTYSEFLCRNGLVLVFDTTPYLIWHLEDVFCGCSCRNSSHDSGCWENAVSNRMSFYGTELHGKIVLPSQSDRQFSKDGFVRTDIVFHQKESIGVSRSVVFTFDPILLAPVDQAPGFATSAFAQII